MLSRTTFYDVFRWKKKYAIAILETQRLYEVSLGLWGKFRAFCFTNFLRTGVVGYFATSEGLSSFQRPCKLDWAKRLMSSYGVC